MLAEECGAGEAGASPVNQAVQAIEFVEFARVPIRLLAGGQLSALSLAQKS